MAVRRLEAARFHNATMLAIGIGLQNIPEGPAVARALVSQRYSRPVASTATVLAATPRKIVDLSVDRTRSDDAHSKAGTQCLLRQINGISGRKG
jgi:hypothetical protein